MYFNTLEKSCFYGLHLTKPAKSSKHVNMNRTNFVSEIQQMKAVIVNFRRKMYLIPFTSSIAVFKKCLNFVKTNFNLIFIHNAQLSQTSNI